MFTNSIWTDLAGSGPSSYPKLTENIQVDVAIIGGGITGITTALLLKQQGYKVAVLEAREVGKGTTGHSTGNLYVITEQLLSPIKSKYDLDVVKKVVQSRRNAFNLISENIKEYRIECDYKVQPMYIYEDESSSKLKDEQEVCRNAGISVSAISNPDFPFKHKTGFVLPEQATFNPYLYVQALAKQVNGGTATIYENTKVEKIEEGTQEVLLTAGSSKIVAKYVLHATHTPKGVEVQYHTVLGPYREYGVAVKIEGDTYPDGIYWGYYNNQKYSIRTYTRNGESFLLCIGEPHKVGQANDNEEHINRIIGFLKKHYKVTEVTHKWGGQHYKPADSLPYIGRKSDNSNQLVATGFSTDGLIYGTLSGILISNLIEGKENSNNDLFKASRHQPVKAAGEFIKENVNVAKEFIKDWLKQEEKDLAEIKPGEAKVIQINGEKAAVYKDSAGAISINSAVCTHMGCVVHWNNAEKSWDCPCHGSRFDTKGEVLEGPALKALKKIEK